MSDEGRLELTLTLHGLDAFNRDVDVEVFSRKLNAFLRGIKQSDKAANGRRRHKLLLTDLRKASASVSVREQVSQAGPVPNSGMEYYADAIDGVFHQRPESRMLPTPLLKDIAALNSGVGHSFSFGEFKSNRGLLVRIDGKLARAANAIVTAREIALLARPNRTRFTGVAFAYFDGVLKLVDLLGQTKKAVLVLTAGEKQIECGVDSLSVEQLRAALDHRVVAYGRAHYGLSSGIPECLEVTKADPVRGFADADLARWRGSFDLSGLSAAEGLN